MNGPVYPEGMRVLVALVAGIGAAFGGTEPRSKPDDYEFSGKAGEVAMGVDFHGRGVSGQNDAFVFKAHLAVEVAVYPPRGSDLDLRSGHFLLKVNGKTSLLPVPAGAVALSLRHDMDETGGNLEALAGAGPVVVGTGRPPAAERFPGDPSPGGRPRNPQPVPNADPSNRTADGQMTPAELVKALALPEGKEPGVRSGLLYFYLKGKLTKLKSLALVYEGPAGRAEFKLMPVR